MGVPGSSLEAACARLAPSLVAALLLLPATVAGADVPAAEPAATLAQAAAGPLQSTTAFLLALPRAVSLLAGRIGPADDAGPDCSGGGRIEVVCEQDGGEAAPATYRITVVDCAVVEAGQSLRLNASARLTTVRLGVACFARDPGELEMFVAIAGFEMRGEGGALLLTLDDIAGRLWFDPAAPPCTSAAMSMSINGEAELQVSAMPDHPLNHAEIRIADIRLHTEVTRRAGACTPSRYITVVNGGMGLRTEYGVFAVLYTDFALAAQIDGRHTAVSLSGRLLSDCLGATIDSVTDEAVRLPEGDPCFRAGALELQHDGDTERLRFLASGGVEIDRGDDGSVEQRFARCVEPALYRCPAP